MCTVSFLPLSDNGVLITANRDESANRNAHRVDQRSFHNGSILYFPQDSLHGGTWFGASDDSSISCILNGAYEPYDRTVSYEKSRGSMPFALVELGSVEAFLREFPFNLVAPFTMLIYNISGLQLLKYDGESINHKILDPNVTHIWSSVTLYPEPVRNARALAFESFLQSHPLPDRGDLVAFHSSHPFGDGSNDFIMNREGIVQTVSITQACITKREMQIYHKDLIGDRVWTRDVKLKSS